jgi:hypothetical protein
MPDMRRVRAIFFTLIIAAIAVHLVWVAIAPLVPYAIGGAVGVGILGLLYYRRRW